MNPVASAASACSSALNFRQRQLDLPGQFFDQPELAGTQALKVGLLQTLPVAGAHGRVKLHLIFFGLAWIVLFVFARQCLLHSGFARHTRCGRGRFGQELRQKLASELRISEKC